MKKILFFLWFIPGFCIAQSRDSTVIMRFNQHFADFNGLKFWNTFPVSIRPDSVKTGEHYSSTDKINRPTVQYRFKGPCMGLNASYYAFCLSGTVHLIQIKFYNLDSTEADRIIQQLSRKLEPLNQNNNGPHHEFHYSFEKEFCTPLNWVIYKPREQSLTFQLSDWFYCTRLEF